MRVQEKAGTIAADAWAKVLADAQLPNEVGECECAACSRLLLKGRVTHTVRRANVCKRFLVQTSVFYFPIPPTS